MELVLIIMDLLDFRAINPPIPPGNILTVNMIMNPIVNFMLMLYAIKSL